MQKVCSPYFDPEFESLAERINGPACRVSIDNDILEDNTVVKIDSVSKQGLLLEVVQVLTDVNLNITKGYISSDAGWFMDVFHVIDERGNKVTDQRVIKYIQQAISAKSSSSSNVKTLTAKQLDSDLPDGPTTIEMTGPDRPGLFSEISTALADLHCNIVEAHAWSHNARIACIAYISDDADIDSQRLAIIEHHLTTILRASPCKDESIQQKENNYDGPTVPVITWRAGSDEEDRNTRHVWVDSCVEKGYSIVTIKCRDRKKLMFDTVCTLTDMQYVIFHASVDSHHGVAFQEYFIRHIDGQALTTESDKKKIIKCLEAAIEHRVCEGIWLELCANNRLGLLSGVTRILRESGLVVVRADIATQGEKSVLAFYIRDLSGNMIDMKFINAIKSEIKPIYITTKDEPLLMVPMSTSRSQFSTEDILKCQMERLIFT